jgi:hypothetical protein
MARVFKVHPAVGIARVGDHSDAFFVGPELSCAPELDGASAIPGVSPVDLDAGGKDVAFTAYKKDGHIRRQGARFRIFSYEQGAGGALTDPREITAGPNVEIIWTVELCNRKASWDHRIGMNGRRNDDVADRNKLIVGPIKRSVSGARQSSDRFPGKFFGHAAQAKDIDLGVLKTDVDGRLIVLGGFGRAFSDGTDPNLVSGNFGNRDGWTDDISDGPVTAQVKVDGQVVPMAGAARVIIGPPDFAPGIGQPVTLFDAMRQTAASLGVPGPTRPSYSRDVLPILSRCTNLRWTHANGLWRKIAKMINNDWAGLSNKTDSDTTTLRQKIADELSGELPLVYTESESGENEMVRLTDVQRSTLSLWAAGTFDRDFGSPVKTSLANPDDLDRGQIDNAVGAGFFPGIEAGDRTKDKNIYAAPFRLKPDLPAGFLTEQMAVPWHSDFVACRTEWWPSQRPDLAPQKSDPDGIFPQWTSGLVSTVPDMIKNMPKLGYIKPMKVNGKDIHAEDERIPPRP